MCNKRITAINFRFSRPVAWLSEWNDVEYDEGSDEFYSQVYIDDGSCADGPPEHPCSLCGGKRTEDGHDPCIANLPGVSNACCGHGVKDAYVAFENGLVIRGEFDHVRKMSGGE